MERSAVHLVVIGRVQGVAFRARAIAEATRLGLAGWVRNRTDGTVEAHAEGAPGRSRPSWPGAATDRRAAEVEDVQVSAVSADRARPRLPGGDDRMSSLCGVLGIRAGSKVSVVNPPPGFVMRLNPLPDGVEFLVTAQTGLDVVLFFARTAGELLSRLPALARSISLPGRIWVAWEEGGERAGRGRRSARPGSTSAWSTTSGAALGDRWVGLRLKRESRARPSRPGSRQPSIADA